MTLKDKDGDKNLNYKDLAKIVHSMKNPISGIIGMSELLAMTSLTDEQKDYLNNLKISVDKLLKRVDDIIDYSKVISNLITLKNNPFYIDNVIDHIIVNFDHLFEEKNIEFIYFKDKDTPNRYIGDELRVTQIIKNILFYLTSNLKNYELILKVEGNFLFDNNYLLKFSINLDNDYSESFENFDIEIYTIKKLLKMMNGELYFSNIDKDKKSLVFTLILESSKQFFNIYSDDNTDFSNENILIADDNRINLEVLKSLLKIWGVSPDIAIDGKTAIQKIKNGRLNNNPYSIVILDYQMPEMDGIEAANIIKTIDPNISIVILSSINIWEHIYKLNLSFIDRYLAKPLRQIELKETILSIIKNRDIRERKSKGIEDKKVLVFEDDDINRQFINIILKNQNWKVTNVKNGKEGVEIFKKEHFDLIIMDIQMPVMNGYNAVQIIRNIETTSNIKKTPIIVVSAFSSNIDKIRMRNVGVDLYLTKPIKPKELTSAISNIISGKLNNKNVYNEKNINFNDIISIFEGDKEVVKDLFDYFLSYYPISLQTIRNAIIKGDNDLLKKEGHKLKGIILNLRIKKGIYNLSTFENSVEIIDKDEMLDIVDNLFLTFKNIQKDIENFFKMGEND